MLGGGVCTASVGLSSVPGQEPLHVLRRRSSEVFTLSSLGPSKMSGVAPGNQEGKALREPVVTLP